MSPFDIFQIASTWPFWEPSSSSPPSPSGWAKGLLRRNHLQQCCSNWTGVRKSCFKLFLTAQNYPLSPRTTFLCVPFRHSTELHVHFACIFSPHNNTLSQELSGTNFDILLNSCHQILCDVGQKMGAMPNVEIRPTDELILNLI